MQVSLSELIEVMKTQPPDGSSYLNLNTGELVTVMDEEFVDAKSGKPLQAYSEWNRTQF